MKRIKLVDLCDRDGTNKHENKINQAIVELERKGYLIEKVSIRGKGLMTHFHALILFKSEGRE